LRGDVRRIAFARRWLPVESFDLLPLHNVESVPPQLVVPALRPGGSQQALLFAGVARCPQGARR